MPLQTDACERGEPCTRQLEVDAPADQQLLTGLPLLEQTIPSPTKASLTDRRGIPHAVGNDYDLERMHDAQVAVRGASARTYE